MARDWSNPLTDLRLLVATAITGNAAIVDAAGGSGHIQIFDRPVDARGDLRKKRKVSPRLQMNSEDGESNFDESSSSARVDRLFSFEVRKKGLDLEAMEWFEWQILRSLAFLYMNRQVDSPAELGEPSPLTILSIKATRNDRELIPINDPDTWSMVCMVVVHTDVSFDALMA